MIPDPSPWAQFGLAGLFALFALVLLIILLKYIEGINKMWKEFLEKESAQRMIVSDAEAARRKEGMEYGMKSVEAMTEAIGGLATALGSHDDNAQNRHLSVIGKLADIELALVELRRRRKA